MSCCHKRLTAVLVASYGAAEFFTRAWPVANETERPNEEATSLTHARPVHVGFTGSHSRVQPSCGGGPQTDMNCAQPKQPAGPLYPGPPLQPQPVQDTWQTPWPFIFSATCLASCGDMTGHNRSVSSLTCCADSGAPLTTSNRNQKNTFDVQSANVSSLT
jgi:hypothetical protein